jgi:hypothetical protein
MSTHSFIGYETDTGSVVGVYCHYDGYLDGVGYVLKKHYTDPAKIKALVELGSLSSLGSHLGEKHTFTDDVDEKEWTTAYHRDRDDELVIAEYDDMYSIASSVYEFMYVYMNQGLWMHKNDSVNSPWLPLI